MNRGSIISYFFVIIIYVATCDDILFSITCPEIKFDNPSQVFKPERLSGLWYNVKVLNESTRDVNFDCDKSIYMTNQTHFTDEIHFKITYRNGTTRPYSSFNRTLTVPEWTFPLKMNLGGRFANASLWILDSDFDGYAVTYFCIQLEPNLASVGKSVRGRKQVLSEEELKKAYAVFHKFNISTEDLVDYKYQDYCQN